MPTIFSKALNSKNGFTIQDLTGILSTETPPNVSPGIVAPISTICLLSTYVDGVSAGILWEKFGVGDVDWRVTHSVDPQTAINTNDIIATNQALSNEITNSIHGNVAGEISAITLKPTPSNTDIILIEDNADSGNKKQITIGSLPSPNLTHNDLIDTTITTPQPQDYIVYNGTEWVNVATATGDIGYIFATASIEGASGNALYTNNATITRTGVGRFTVVFTQAHPNANYPITFGVSGFTALRDGTMVLLVDGSQTINGFDVMTVTGDNGGTADPYQDRDWSFMVGNNKELRVIAAQISNAIHDDIPNELSTIPPKAAPDGTDILLIEDSTDGNNKKSTTIDNIMPIFGTEYQYMEDNTPTTTTSTTNINKLTMATPILGGGRYRLGWNYLWARNNTSSDIIVTISIDGGEIYEMRVEAKDSAGTNPSFPAIGTDQKMPISNFRVVGLSSGVHTITMDFRSSGGAVATSIWDARFEFWRVG